MSGPGTRATPWAMFQLATGRRRSCDSVHGSLPPLDAGDPSRWLRWSRPAAARLAIIDVTSDRPSRHTRAQRANAAATSCTVPIRRTSSSRGSPSTGSRDGAAEARPRCRSTIPGDPSAATWYQAALSTWSASSRAASASAASTWDPGCAAADWNFRASSSSSDARVLRRSAISIWPGCCGGPVPDMGRNVQMRPAALPFANGHSGDAHWVVSV